MTGAPRSIDCQSVMDRLRQNAGEWAFVDLREAGEAAEGHPFGSVNIPFSRMERDVAALVPRRSVPVVLFDGGDGVAERAALRLAQAGWTDVSVVRGGARAWADGGLALFKGEHSCSKAFGEWVGHAFGVPEIGPDALALQMEGESPPLLLDGRPLAEHRAFTLPGSVNCPNGELALRLPPDADKARIVVHCAGRTRSIIGAQTLRDFGLGDQVVALRDGTQGWELSGRLRETGADRPLAMPVGAAGEVLEEAAVARARGVMARFGLATVDPARAADWAQDDGRTTYFIDPRPEGEGATPQGFMRAEATTLIQQTDRFIAVRGARVVLWDPVLVRAVFAALWLDRMGFDACVLTGDPLPVPVGADLMPPAPPWIDAALLAGVLAGGAVLLDLRPAALFRECHIAGAIRAVRPRLDRTCLAEGVSVVLVAADRDVAALVAGDLARAGHAVAGCAAHDPDAWRAAGLALVRDAPADPLRDFDEVRFCAGRHRGNLDDARAYLAWETGLLDRLLAAGLRFWPAPRGVDGSVLSGSAATRPDFIPTQMMTNRKTAGA